MEVNENQEQQTQERSFTDEDFFKYANEHFKEQLGKEINSVDDLFVTKIEEREKEIPTVPEYLKPFDEFHKNTNRPIEDYVKWTKDWGETPEDSRVAEYLRRTKPYLDEDDIKDEISDMKGKMKLSEDDDADDPLVQRGLKKAEREWKTTVHTATELLQSERQKYAAPIPDAKKQVDEATESFNSEFLKQLNVTESIKAGDLEYKFSKESLKNVKSLGDIVKAMTTSEDGSMDVNKAIRNLVIAQNFDQILKDSIDNALVAAKDLELKQKNNAVDDAKTAGDKSSNSDPSRYRAALRGY